jgi:RNA polymerase sigma-B factor
MGVGGDDTPTVRDDAREIVRSTATWLPSGNGLERSVIVLRYFQDLDQSAIAARIGCSQMHVSRLLRRALARMRAQLLEP